MCVLIFCRCAKQWADHTICQDLFLMTGATVVLRLLLMLKTFAFCNALCGGIFVPRHVILSPAAAIWLLLPQYPELEVLWLTVKSWNVGAHLYVAEHVREAEKWCALALRFLARLDNYKSSYEAHVSKMCAPDCLLGFCVSSPKTHFLLREMAILLILFFKWQFYS